MLHRKFTLAAIVTLVGSASVVVIALRGHWAASAGRGEASSIAPGIEVVRLTPPSDTCDEIECPSLDFVHFTYQVFNRGQAPITGLKLGTKCGCENVGIPPEAIPPGGSGTVRFRLRAPLAGRLPRKIPLLADGSTEPVAVLDACLRVKFDPPALIPPPDGLSFTFVAGEGESTREFVVETIEAKQDDCWIRGVELDPADGLESERPAVQEFPEPDPKLTRRQYRFALSNASLPAGRHTATAKLKTRPGMPLVGDPLILSVVVNDPVAIVPNPLVIRYTPGSPAQSRRACVIDRTGARSTATIAEYDHDVLRVEPVEAQNGSTTAFNVVPIQTPEVPLNTRIIFRLRNDETREMAVRFEPSSRP